MSSAHRPTDNRIVHKECASLSAAGYDVSFVVCGSGPERISGTHIEYVPASPTRRGRLTAGTYRVFTAARRLDADLYHIHDPELFPYAVALHALDKKVVIDVHENPDRRVPWVSRRWRRPLASFSRSVHRGVANHVDGIVAATPRIGKFFAPAKTAVACNYPIVPENAPPVDYAQRPMRVIYAGEITRARGAVDMVAAIADVDASLDAELVLAGRFGRPSVEPTLKSLPGWKRTRYLGLLDPAEVPAQLENARIGLCVLHPWSNYVGEGLSTKLFEYMLAGTPIVASDFPAWRRQLGDIGCALFVDPEDASAIAAAITTLVDEPETAAQMGERGRRAVIERFNWASQAEHICELYQRILR